MVSWSKVLGEMRRKHAESGEETLSNLLAFGAHFSLASRGKAHMQKQWHQLHRLKEIKENQGFTFQIILPFFVKM